MAIFGTIHTGAVLSVGLDDPASTPAQDSQPINERHPDSVHDASRVTEPSDGLLARSARCKTPISRTLEGIRFGGVLHSHSVCRRFAEAHK